MNSTVFNKIMSLILNIQDIKNNKDSETLSSDKELTKMEDELYVLIMTMT